VKLSNTQGYACEWKTARKTSTCITSKTAVDFVKPDFAKLSRKTDYCGDIKTKNACDASFAMRYSVMKVCSWAATSCVEQADFKLDQIAHAVLPKPGDRTYAASCKSSADIPCEQKMTALGVAIAGKKICIECKTKETTCLPTSGPTQLVYCE
jgi:hypothetical protein